MKVAICSKFCMHDDELACVSDTKLQSDCITVWFMTEETDYLCTQEELLAAPSSILEDSDDDTIDMMFNDLLSLMMMMHTFKVCMSMPCT